MSENPRMTDFWWFVCRWHPVTVKWNSPRMLWRLAMHRAQIEAAVLRGREAIETEEAKSLPMPERYERKAERWAPDGCEQCWRPDTAEAHATGRLLPLWIDHETGETVCEECKRGREVTK